ncbi:DUF3500 domain-containing protein [Micromonospora radicis]|uniref:DUF3500 domain-containing protein n=1 Tax=Micromonospora radicis TaxID=1894971 RepID=A0A418MPB2_9ACTN|nr:DUF3500 domain-containing protein [Micromonospora radicis]RIV34331.1 DUF3500 domain-containing protein [Micromonospora radicis]
MRARISLMSAVVATTVGLSACVNGTAGGDAAAPAVPSDRPTPTTGGVESAGVAESVVASAGAFLASLSAELRDKASYDAADPALRQWIYFPSTRDRNGVAFGDLTDEQRAAALGVAEAVLSDSGYQQLRGVLAAEDALGVRNHDTAVSSDRYFIAFFGEPGVTERFTVQVNGHHLAVNTTYENGRVSPTPAFTGVDPVDFEVDGQRVRPMLAKTQAVSDLLDGLGEGELAAARIGPIDDVRVGTGASEQYPESAGTLVTDLGAEQQERVVAVVRAWVGDADERVAEPLMEQYQAEFDRTRVAWSGSTDPDTPGSYLRIDGPRLWIEFSNVGRFGNGDNHYHSVYRDRQIDYLG